ncbi:MAG: hypothetical protein ACLFTR_01140 [Candidatus Woesearchaeota archaeon]
MEAYQRLRDEANKKISLADHMLFITYPLVKDSKLLLAVIENIFLAHTHIMGSLLYYERMYKRVAPFFDTFESKYRLFSEKCAPRYAIEDEYLELMRKVKDILTAHKRSPMEFSRKDQFVICSEDYQLNVLKAEDIKILVSKTKEFFNKVDSLIGELERKDKEEGERIDE